MRYADDSNVYVRSEQAGLRVTESIKQFIENKLKLKVNESKSVVARPKERKFLGFSFTGGNKNPNRRKIAPKSLDRFKAKIRVLTNPNSGRSIGQVVEDLTSYLYGWGGYFGFCETPRVLIYPDSWICRRLRYLIWRQWKVYGRRWRELVKREIDESEAKSISMSGHGCWKMSHIPVMRVAFPNFYFDSLELPRLAEMKRI